MAAFRQNFMLMNTILTAVATGFEKVFQNIRTEAVLAESTGRKKEFRMGENSPEMAGHHTGTSDCPVAFEVELDPQEWRILAVRAVSNDIYDKGDGRQTLESLITGMEKRQRRWHDIVGHGHQDSTCEGDMTCFRLIRQIRMMIDGYPR